MVFHEESFFVNLESNFFVDLVKHEHLCNELMMKSVDRNAETHVVEFFALIFAEFVAPKSVVTTSKTASVF